MVPILNKLSAFLKLTLLNHQVLESKLIFRAKADNVISLGFRTINILKKIVIHKK